MVKKLNVNWRNHVVGQLSYDGYYTFQYSDSLESAIDEGFRPFIAFPDLTGRSVCSWLFPAFKSRLPDKRRPDIKRILAKYDMTCYDEWELLKRSGAKLPIDEIYFTEGDVL